MQFSNIGFKSFILWQNNLDFDSLNKMVQLYLLSIMIKDPFIVSFLSIRRCIISPCKLVRVCDTR